MKASWKEIKKYSDIKFEFYNGVAKVTINRPKVYNAFRPETNNEMLDAFDICRERNDIDVVVITGAEEIVKKSLTIASDICIYTNSNLTIEKINV